MGKAEEDWQKAESRSLIVGIIPDVSNDMIIVKICLAMKSVDKDSHVSVVLLEEAV